MTCYLSFLERSEDNTYNNVIDIKSGSSENDQKLVYENNSGSTIEDISTESLVHLSTFLSNHCESTRIRVIGLCDDVRVGILQSNSNTTLLEVEKLLSKAKVMLSEDLYNMED